MSEEQTKETKVVEAPKKAEATAPARAPRGKAPVKGRTPFKRRPRSFDRPKPEFDQKIINIRRVTRVMAGGRRFSFSVAMILGDRKGRVGIGVGKSPDTALAIQKAVKDARKNMIKVGLTSEMSIPHEIESKYASSEIKIFPNNGKGLVAGSAVRDMLDLAGVRDVTAKINTRSKNKINIARAVVKALHEIEGTTKVVVKEPEPRKAGPRTFTRRDTKKS